MPRDRNEELREALVRLLGRPILVVFWALVVWGTVYGVMLVQAAYAQGFGVVVASVLGGRDLLGGVANLVLTGTAALVWLGVAVAAWRGRVRRRTADRQADRGKPG